MKSDRVNRAVGEDMGEDRRDRVVGSVGLDDPRKRRVEMVKDGRGSESLLESLESTHAVWGEIPRSGLLGQSSERDRDLRVIVDKSTIEIGEAEEGLDVSNIPRLGPREDRLDLLGVHADAVGADDIAEIFDAGRVELAFLGLAIEVVESKTFEDFADAFDVVRFVIGVGEDEDIVEVDDDRDIEEIGEDLVHKALEGCGCVGETEWHNEVLEGSISRSERGLPLIARGDANVAVADAEIELRELLGGSKAIERRLNERKRILVFSSDLVESSIIDAESKGAIGFLDEENGGTAGRGG